MKVQPGGVQLLLLAAAVAATLFSRTALGPLQDTMRMALSFSDNQMALLQGSALALPVVLASVALGLLIDRYSRVRLILAFTALSLAGSLLTAFTASFATLFLARAMVGLAAAATWIAALSLIGDLYAPAQRGRATTVVAIAGVAGMSAAFASGGELLAYFNTSDDAWSLAMFGLCAPLVPIVFLTFAMREPERTGRIVEKPSARQVWSELLRYRAVVMTLLAGGVMLGIADGAALVWAAPILSRSFGLSPQRVGSIVAMALLLNGTLGPLLGGALADLCQRTGGPRRTVLALGALAFLAIPAGLFAIAPGVMAFTILLIVFLVFGTAVAVGSGPLVTVVLPNETRGLCFALMSAAGQLFGFGLAPLTVSALSGIFLGPDAIAKALAVVCVTTTALGAAVFAHGRRHFLGIAPHVSS